MGRCESVACCRVLLCYNFVTFKRIASKGLDTMLVASIENAEAHDYLSERLKKAYAFLRENDLGALSCGRHDIDGEDVFANVMEYDTVPAEAKKLEAHKLYYDVQCVVSGIERVEVAPLEGLVCAKEYCGASSRGRAQTGLHRGGRACTCEEGRREGSRITCGHGVSWAHEARCICADDMEVLAKAAQAVKE